jgi:serine protease Do
MNHRTISTLHAVFALPIVLLLPSLPMALAAEGGTIAPPAPYEDISNLMQRFADGLGGLKERDLTIAPAKLAEQADAEPAYPFVPAAPPAAKLDSEKVYAQSKPGVVIVGGVYKCDKCQHWHVQCASGFVVRRDGLIVTNFHVVEGFKKLGAVGVMTDDGRVFAAKSVLAASRLNDVALLKVEADNLRPLPLAADVPVGATVYCLSHPALPSGKANAFYMFSQGIVCGKFMLHNEKGLPLRVLAVTTDYGPGSSGGPLLDDHGAVIGITSQSMPLMKQDGEKSVQMLWRFGRPACSILDMLNGTKPKAASGKDKPAADHADSKTAQGGEKAHQ